MSIVPTVLHPENDPSVDLHPKTDAGQVTDFLNKTYPVNSIYLSVDSTSPASLFGGTWTRIQNGFLLSAGYNSISNGATGGSKDAIIPYHNHSFVVTDTQIRGSGGNPLFQGRTGGTEHSGYMLHISWETAESDYLRLYGGSVEYTGSSVTNANMPPYLAVYMWKRVS